MVKTSNLDLRLLQTQSYNKQNNALCHDIDDMSITPTILTGDSIIKNKTISINTNYIAILHMCKNIYFPCLLLAIKNTCPN